jgi:PKD repeat protein
MTAHRAVVTSSRRRHARRYPPSTAPRMTTSWQAANHLPSYPRFISLKPKADFRVTLLSNCNQHDRLQVRASSCAQNRRRIFSRRRRARRIIIITPLLFLLIPSPIHSQRPRPRPDVETRVPQRRGPQLTDSAISAKVELKVNPQRVEVGKDVFFEVTSQLPGGNIEYRFDFGDRSATNWNGQPQTTHAYDSPGFYRVYAEIRGREGVLAHRIVKTVEKQVEVIPARDRPTPPEGIDRNLQVYLSSDANHVRVGKSVTFSISTNDARPHAYELNFGDQSQIVRTKRNSIPHTFRARGNYTVAVTVLDHPSHARARLGISVDRQPLEVYLSADAAQARAGERVIFSISTNDGSTHEYRLNFGDQSPVVQTRKNRLPHTFRARGNYTVSVTVLDDPSHPGDEVRIRIGPPRKPEPPSWTYVVAALVAAVLFYKILKWLFRSPPPVPPPPPLVPPLLTFHPHWDSSTAPTKRQENIAVNYELHFDRNVSKGRYQLEIRGPELITSIRRNNA